MEYAVVSEAQTADAVAPSKAKAKGLNAADLLPLGIILLFLSILFPANAFAGGDLHLCDQIGAMDIDDARVGVPVKREDYNPSKVAKACREALVIDPDSPRFHFQLGTALLVLDPNEAVRHLQIAADQKHVAATAALFILYRNMREMERGK